jgi:hypothetical protein
LQHIEKSGQAFLDSLGVTKQWLVPKSLADQVEAILKKHNLVVRFHSNFFNEYPDEQ